MRFLQTAPPALFAHCVGLSQALSFVLDCTSAVGACSNDCYGANVAGCPIDLTWDKSHHRSRRRASGCKMRGNDRSPCGINKKDPVDPYFKNGDTCDETPYAAVTQGGAEAVLACVSEADNKNEGEQLSSFVQAEEGCNNEAPCDFTVMLKEGTYDNIGYCNSEKTNRGDEFKLSNGKYVNAKRSKSVVTGDVDDDQVFELHVPDPALFIAPHERRQFLLADGHRTLLMGRHADKNFTGTVIVHGDGTSSTVVRELFGDEKSPQFRPTIL